MKKHWRLATGVYILQKIEKCSVARSKLFRRSLAGNFWNATYFCWDLLYPTKKVWVATFNFFFEFSKQVGKGDFSSLSIQRLEQLHSPLYLTCKSNNFSYTLIKIFFPKVTTYLYENIRDYCYVVQFEFFWWGT